MFPANALIHFFVLMLIPFSGTLEPVNLQDQDQVALEQAKILEKVRKSPEQALKLYQDLIKNSKSQLMIQKARLGEARCLGKMGKYEDAQAILMGLTAVVTDKAMIDEIKSLQLSVMRFKTKNQDSPPSSVDLLVSQLLDAASGMDEKRAHTAKSEIHDMGLVALPMLKAEALADDYFRSVTTFGLMIEMKLPETNSFIVKCSKSDDLSLRKRCMDALKKYGSGKKDTYFEPLEARVNFLDDPDPSIRQDAITSFRYIRNSYDLSENMDHVIRAFNILIRHLEGPEPRSAMFAFSCLNSYFDVLDDSPDVYKKIPSEMGKKIISIAENIIKETIQTKKWHKWFDYGPSLFIPRVSKIFNQPHLLQNAVQAWPYDIYMAQRAAQEAGPEAITFLTREVLKDNTTKNIFQLFNISQEKLMSIPSADLQNLLFRGALLLSEKSFYPSWILRSKTPWPPECWAAIVTGLLENQNLNENKNRKDEHYRLKALYSYLNYECTDKTHPAYISAWKKWASHPDFETKRTAANRLRALVDPNTIPLGGEGALGIIEALLHSLPEDFWNKDYNPSDSTYNSRDIRGMFDIIHQVINQIQLKADQSMFQTWLLEKTNSSFKNRLIDYNATVKSSLLTRIIAEDKNFVLNLWPMVDSNSKERLFELIYKYQVGDKYTTSHEWFLPIFKDWVYDPAWSTEGLTNFIYFLGGFKSQEVADQIKEVVVAILNNPKAQTNNAIQQAFKLIENLPHDHKVLWELIPLWYTKLRPDVLKRRQLKLTQIFTSSPEAYAIGFSWLEKEFPESFTNIIIESLLPRHTSPEFLGDLNLVHNLIKTWPNLNSKLRELLLFRLFSANASTICHEFYTYLMKDTKTRPDHRHLAFGALFSECSKKDVGVLLAYIKNLEPKEGEGALRNSKDSNKYVINETQKLLRSKSIRLESISNDSKQMFCMELLSLPVDKCPFSFIMAKHFKVTNDDELKFALQTFYKPFSADTKIELLNDIIPHLLETDPDQAHDILKKILDEEICQNEYLIVQASFDLIKKHEIKSLLHPVGKMILKTKGRTTSLKGLDALAKIKTNDAVPYLMECLRTKEGEVLKRAKEILDLMRDYEDQKRTWEAYMGENKEKVKSTSHAILEMLKHEDPEIRMAAIKSLGKVADDATLPILLKLMAEGSPEERAAAKEAIDRITETNKK